MKRVDPWIIHTTITFVCFFAIMDVRKPSDRDIKDLVILGTSLASVLIGTLMISANFVERLNKLFVGNICEIILALFLSVCWLSAVIFLHNPNNGIATSMSFGGEEIIEYANLYFSGWLSFFSSIYLLASIFSDKESFDPKLKSWFLLFCTSMILFGTSCYLQEDICNDRSQIFCDRDKFGIAIGAIISFVSIVAIVILACMKTVQPLIDLSLSAISSMFYIFGVILLTSASGPAQAIGTQYFASWAGVGFSFSLFVESFQELFLEEDEVEEALSLGMPKVIRPAADPEDDY